MLGGRHLLFRYRCDCRCLSKRQPLASAMHGGLGPKTSRNLRCGVVVGLDVDSIHMACTSNGSFRNVARLLLRSRCLLDYNAISLAMAAGFHTLDTSVLAPRISGEHHPFAHSMEIERNEQNKDEGELFCTDRQTSTMNRRRLSRSYFVVHSLQITLSPRQCSMSSHEPPDLTASLPIHRDCKENRDMHHALHDSMTRGLCHCTSSTLHG